MPKFIVKVLFLREASTQRVILRLVPIAAIFLISRRWHTESAALKKSKYTTSMGAPLSIMSALNSSDTIKLVRHARLSVNPR